jgi:ornithine carbamoyltransferase
LKIHEAGGYKGEMSPARETAQETTAIEMRTLPLSVLRAHRSLTSLATMSMGDFLAVLDDARDVKAKPFIAAESMRGKVLGLIFEQPSLRTRVSFETAMLEMGGHALYLHPSEVGLGRREDVGDVARVLGGYVDAVVVRTLAHEIVERFAQEATVPTINGLSSACHPCQGLTDAFTIRELIGRTSGVHVAYVGDGNGVATSLMFAAAFTGMNLRMACPRDFSPRSERVSAARVIAQASGAKIEVGHDPNEAVRDAEVIYTDSWRAPGVEHEIERRRHLFRGFSVDETLVAMASPQVVVLHDLPANRGEEISSAVLDGPHSRVLLQARNRVPVQKAVLRWLMAPP